MCQQNSNLLDATFAMGGWETALRYYNQQDWYTTYEIKAWVVFTASVRNSRLNLRSSQVLDTMTVYLYYYYLFWRVAKGRSGCFFKHNYLYRTDTWKISSCSGGHEMYTFSHNPRANYCVGKTPPLDLILNQVRNIFRKFFKFREYYHSTGVQNLLSFYLLSKTYVFN